MPRQKQIKQREMIKTFNTRNLGYCSDEVACNFIFLYGCASAKTVAADTALVE